MADNLIPQHKRLACGDDIDVPEIESPFKQVTNIDHDAGKKPAMSDAARKRTAQSYD